MFGCIIYTQYKLPFETFQHNDAVSATIFLVEMIFKQLTVDIFLHVRWTQTLHGCFIVKTNM